MEPFQHNTQTSDPVETSQPTIDFLISMNTPFVVNLWCGGFDAAREHGANFVCFADNAIYPAIPLSEYRFNSQANIVYELNNPEYFDELVFCNNILLAIIQAEEFQHFCARYYLLPMVSIAVPAEGLLRVMVNYYAGMYEVVSHLINVHGYRSSKILSICLRQKRNTNRLPSSIPWMISLI
jgi:hypothetical protein